MSKDFEEIVLQKLENFEKFEEFALKKLQNFEGTVLQKLQNLEQDVQELKTDVTVLKEDVEVLKESVVVIEDKVTTEIPALFEGYSMHQDEQQIIIGRENYLELLAEEHSIRITNLEETSKEHSKKIKQLIS